VGRLSSEFLTENPRTLVRGVCQGGDDIIEMTEKSAKIQDLPGDAMGNSVLHFETGGNG
jgi:hypothetical protein